MVRLLACIALLIGRGLWYLELSSVASEAEREADGESVTQTVTVTVTGAEDAPVISGTSSGAVAEDGVLASTGTLATSDADATTVP